MFVAFHFIIYFVIHVLRSTDKLNDNLRLTNIIHRDGESDILHLILILIPTSTLPQAYYSISTLRVRNIVCIL